MEILISELTQAIDINPCHRTIVFNTCEIINMSGDILNADENFEDKDDYGFIQQFFKKALIIIDENTRTQLMKMHRTQKLNTYEQLFNNTISENIDETK